MATSALLSTQPPTAKPRTWFRRFKALGEAALLIASLALMIAWIPAQAAQSEQVLPLLSASSQRGAFSNQGLEVLGSQQQSGTEDNWDSYIEAAPDQRRFTGTFVFKYDPEAAAGGSGTLLQLRLQANTLGSAAEQQKWWLQIRNDTTGKWQTLGDNSAASSWVWRSHDYWLGHNVQRFINANGQIKIRYRSNNAYDVSNIDFLQLSAIVETNTNGGPDGDGSDGSTETWWQPSPQEQLSWQWQINGALDTSLDVDMYDIDLFDTSAAQIAALKADGRTVVCYFSAGTYEGWRSDWPEFFPFIDGNQYAGNEAPFAAKMADWDERWLDIRHIELLAPIMRSRLQLAKEKGCDAVEPDNVDAYSNGSETQLPLSYGDQLAYNRWLANEAHALGLSIGLKNDVSQLADLVEHFDWAINEQCFYYQECADYAVFTSQGKAVFGVEYSGNPDNFCPQANSMQMSWMKKRTSLKSWRKSCTNYP